MTGWSAEKIGAAAAAWVWVPEDARRVDHDDYLLVDFSPGYDDACPTQVQWTRSGRTPDELIDEASAQTRAWDRNLLGWWIRADTSPAALEPTLLARGATVAERVHVLALELDDGPPDRDLGTRWELVHDERTLRDASRVLREVWGGPEASPEQWERDLAEASLPVAERPMFQVVAYVDGKPASAGGCTRAGDVARLWGAATRPTLRGRGAYRATVSARLRLAQEQGATLGLVKGLVDTSGPILSRLGFTTYGEERKLTLDLPS
jgi:hypothetical protein